MPIHIRAEPGSVADKAVIAGDPGRVMKLSTLLDSPKTVNENRGFLVRTGTYNGQRITVATHGIGAPSVALVVEELAMLGVKTFVRYGTTGTVSPDVNIGDFIIASAAKHTPGGAFTQYFHGKKGVRASADKELTKSLKRAFKNKGLKFHVGKVFSSDAFYAESGDFAQKWFDRGVLSAEMECAMLFKLSNAKGWKSAAALIVSDCLDKGRFGKWSNPEEIDRKAMEGATAVLDALTK